MNRLTAAILLTAFVVFPLGLAVGFGLGIYSTELCEELYSVATSKEEMADVANATKIARTHFQLEYPGNWTLARNEKHFDIDQYFSIDTPGYSYVLFAISPVTASPKSELKDSTEYFSKLLRASRTSSFAKWGRYSGSGVHLVGSYVGEPAEVRIFSHTSDGHTFTVTEFFDTATKKDVKCGYDLIEATFVLHSQNNDHPSASVVDHSAELISTDVDHK